MGESRSAGRTRRGESGKEAAKSGETTQDGTQDSASCAREQLLRAAFDENEDAETKESPAKGLTGRLR
jgi:hypothetical protein